jgi:hypothetical protein
VLRRETVRRVVVTFRPGKKRRRPPRGERLHLEGDKPNSVPSQLPAPVTIISLDPPKRIAALIAERWCDYYPEAAGLRRRDRRPGLPVMSCTAWGLSCPGTCAPGGGLLPRLFTLTRDCLAETVGGLFSVTLSIAPDFGPAPPRVLRGMLPVGVRTFLCRSETNSDRLPTAVIFSRPRAGAIGKLCNAGLKPALVEAR